MLWLASGVHNNGAAAVIAAAAIVPAGFPLSARARILSGGLLTLRLLCKAMPVNPETTITQAAVMVAAAAPMYVGEVRITVLMRN
ncbi:hypothetical protein KCP73_23070 [Salmonella enterica subsp. enterica]|nr:hypothetical protein KCP73_23070 [Salmonella enterica subsp. enterica]